MHLDPSRLLLLLDIRAQGSLTRAAERTGRTPPAVSQQLARLEHEVGAQLVDRHRHGASLTPLGLRLAEYAQRVDAALQEAAEHTATYLDRHRDRLRVGAFPTAGLALLPEVLAAMRHQHPQAELSVADLGPYQGVTLVAEHDLDLALVGEYGEDIDVPPGVELVHLANDPIHVVLPSSHSKADAADHVPPRLSDFATDEWASAPRTLPNRRQLERAAAEQGFTPTIPFESESYAVAEAVVSAGVAVSFIPRLAITKVPGTVDFPIVDPVLSRCILAAIPRSSSHAPLTSVCLRLLHRVCGERGMV